MIVYDIISGKGEKMNKKIDTKTITELALLIAITLIMGFTPLGTIPTPILVISLVTIPVAVAAIIMGPSGGAIVGGVFGLTSLINAVTGRSALLSTLFAVSPIGVVVTALVPRILEGLLTGLIFVALSKIKPLKSVKYYIAAVCCPLLNTLFFMSSLMIFYYNTEYMQGLAEKFGSTNPVSLIVAMVGIQGVVEAVVCLIIGGAVSQAVSKALKKA